MGSMGGFPGVGNCIWQHAPGLPLLPCGDGAQTVSNIKSGARERGTAPSVSRPTGYRVPPLAAKPRSRRTPHARTFGPSTECTRCICAARKPTAWLHDTARCPRSIRDSVEQCAAPCRCEHQRSIRTSRVCCHALSTRATAPLQTFGVVAVRQRSVHCS